MSDMNNSRKDRAILAFEMGDYENLPGMRTYKLTDERELDVRRELTAALQIQYPRHREQDIQADIDEAMVLWRTDATGQFIHTQALNHTLTALGAVSGDRTVSEMLVATGRALRKGFISRFIEQTIQLKGEIVK